MPIKFPSVLIFLHFVTAATNRWPPNQRCNQRRLLTTVPHLREIRVRFLPRRREGLTQKKYWSPIPHRYRCQLPFSHHPQVPQLRHIRHLVRHIVLPGIQQTIFAHLVFQTSLWIPGPRSICRMFESARPWHTCGSSKTAT